MNHEDSCAVPYRRGPTSSCLIKANQENHGSLGSAIHHRLTRYHHLTQPTSPSRHLAMAVTSLPPRPQQRRPPRQTPDWVIDGLKAAVLANDEHPFMTLLSGQTRIQELSEVMYTALECDHAAAAVELVQRGFRITYGVAELAAMSRAKKCLAVFFSHGMDINFVPSRTETSVFAYVLPERPLAGALLTRLQPRLSRSRTGLLAPRAWRRSEHTP